MGKKEVTDHLEPQALQAFLDPEEDQVLTVAQVLQDPKG